MPISSQPNINLHASWQQGQFIDMTQYRSWTPQQKEKAQALESLIVRPSQTQNPICSCQHPEDAAWIAGRLNLAATLQHQKDSAVALMQPSWRHKAKKDADVLECYVAMAENQFKLKNEKVENLQSELDEIKRDLAIIKRERDSILETLQGIRRCGSSAGLSMLKQANTALAELGYEHNPRLVKKEK